MFISFFFLFDASVFFRAGEILQGPCGRWSAPLPLASGFQAAFALDVKEKAGLQLDVRLARPLDFIGDLSHLERDFALLLRRTPAAANATGAAPPPRLNTAESNRDPRCGLPVWLNGSLAARGTPLRAALCELLESDVACGLGAEEC